MRPADRHLVIGLCTYEMTALITKKLPTISKICRKHRWVEAAFLAWLIVHLHRKETVCP
jgi:hypothetical protein